MSGSGICWAICKSAPRSRQITTPAPHRSVFYRPDALPAAQPTESKDWRQYLEKFRSRCNISGAIPDVFLGRWHAGMQNGTAGWKNNSITCLPVSNTHKVTAHWSTVHQLCPLPTPYPHHFSKLTSNSEIWNFTVQIKAYQGIKVNAEVNECFLKNLGTYWNTRHHHFNWYQFPSA